MLPELVENIVKLKSMTTALSKLFADDDASYDCNDIFRYLSDGNGFLPCIKVTNNASGLKKTILLEIINHGPKRDLQKWKEDRLRYVKRCIVETVFSYTKRMFGE